MKEEGLPQWNPEEDVGYRSIYRVIKGNCEWQKLKYHSKKLAILIFFVNIQIQADRHVLVTV